MATKDINALKQVNRSGFPFQLKVEYDLQATAASHHWSVASREHAWTDSEGNEGFIDIVLKNDQIPTFRLVLECKRVKADDARQLQWLFLVEQGKADFIDRASCFEVESNIDARLWDDVWLSPPSLEAQFCVLQGDEPRRGLLEHLSTDLLESTEGLAQEEIRIQQSIRNADQRGRPLHVRLFLFPVIVTNAKIAVCQFDPSRVDRAQGTLEPDDAKVFEVGWIRFRKSLATEFPEGVYYHLEAANRARERTVLVVNAEHLIEFLTKWEMGRIRESGFAIERLLQDARERQ